MLIVMFKNQAYKNRAYLIKIQQKKSDLALIQGKTCFLGTSVSLYEKQSYKNICTFAHENNLFYCPCFPYYIRCTGNLLQTINFKLWKRFF